jgi:hypothetical protein
MPDRMLDLLEYTPDRTPGRMSQCINHTNANQNAR